MHVTSIPVFLIYFGAVFCHLGMLKRLHEDHRALEPQGEAREQQAMGKGRRKVEPSGTSICMESQCHGRTSSVIGKTLVVPRRQFFFAIFPQRILHFSFYLETPYLLLTFETQVSKCI